MSKSLKIILAAISLLLYLNLSACGSPNDAGPTAVPGLSEPPNAVTLGEFSVALTYNVSPECENYFNAVGKLLAARGWKARFRSLPLDSRAQGPEGFDEEAYLQGVMKEMMQEINAGNAADGYIVPGAARKSCWRPALRRTCGPYCRPPRRCIIRNGKAFSETRSPLSLSTLGL